MKGLIIQASCESETMSMSLMAHIQTFSLQHGLSPIHLVARLSMTSDCPHDENALTRGDD